MQHNGDLFADMTKSLQVSVREYPDYPHSEYPEYPHSEYPEYPPQ